MSRTSTRAPTCIRSASILYVLLTGLQPFETKRRQRPALDEWLRQLREEEPPTPSAKLGADRRRSHRDCRSRGTEPQAAGEQLRGDLDWITMKALERERERRYGTPSELAADLRRLPEPTSLLWRVRRVPRIKLRKFIRRHRIAAVVAGVMAISGDRGIGRRIDCRSRSSMRRNIGAAQALQAQSQMLTQAAAQRLKDSDVAGAQGIILEVLTNPAFAQVHTPAAISVFQEVRAADAQLAVLSGHGERVNSAAYSPDGTRIVTASFDKTARIWDARTGVQLAVLSGHGDRVIPPPTRPMARASLPRRRTRPRASGMHARRAARRALRPRGSRLVPLPTRPTAPVSSPRRMTSTARIWDARTGAQLRVLPAIRDRLRSTAYSPDGTRIVTRIGGQDRTDLGCAHGRTARRTVRPW